MEDRKLVLIVIDGLTPGVFERVVEGATTPALSFLAEHGAYRRATTTFPSLTPVCLSTLATGVHPDVHRIPHLVWYHERERRLVEYGSSFSAVRAAGTAQSVRDAVFNLNAEHLSREATTVFEALDDAGVTTAGVNMVCYRGRTRHEAVLPGLTRPVYGPRRFYYFNLFESDRTGAPIAVRGRHLGSVDQYAASIGRWLVTRDGFDFLLYYLPDYDYASHAGGPGGADAALARTDRAIAALLEAAGGADEFLDRYSVLVCSDHGQTPVQHGVRLQSAFADYSLFRRPGDESELAVTASNRAGQIYRLPSCRSDVDELAAVAAREESAEIVLFRDGEDAVALRAGEELRFRPGLDGFTTSGDESLLPPGDAVERAWAALANPNAGDVLVSAAPGFEFADLGGRHHAGGGSHGSLDPGDSEVPMLGVGVDPPSSLTEVAATAVRHFGVEPPSTMREAAHAA